MECIICSEEITVTTGRTVLGCGHEFHMMCVAQWFCRQEGASSCPCCRRESGTYDDLPQATEADDSDSDWESDDSASHVSVEVYWKYDDTVRVWHQIFRETMTTKEWDPVMEPTDVPEEIEEGAVCLQSLWRGYRARQRLLIAEALLILKASTEAEAEADPVSFA